MSPFEPLNDYFDRILVLTLRRAADRQERLRDRLAGLRYELHFGADGREMDRAALEREGIFSEERARRVHRHGHSPSMGQIGCALSHRQAYRRILDEGWRRVLLFEDDVVPIPAALPSLPAVLEQLPPDWELVYFGYERGETTTPWDRVKQAAYLPMAALRVIKWTPRQVLGLRARPYSANLRVAGKHLCTHAYAVSRSGAEKLLAEQTPVAFLADQLLSHLCMGGELRCLVTEPKFFDQDSVHGRIASHAT